MKKILVLGYFGYINNQLDGQTIKTRDVYNILKKNSDEKIYFFDTQSFKHSKLNFFKMMILLSRVDVVFYLPAHNNLKYLFPLIFFFTKMINIKLNYLVVGGWLFDFLKNKPIHRYILTRIQAIYLETDDLLLNLRKYNFKNIYKLYNFRVIDYPILNLEEPIEIDIKLVFMARVQPEKGLGVIFDLDMKLKELKLDNVCIDVYGPVLDSYKDEFFNKINTSSINYCGVIQPEDIYSVLQRYDIMLFPTKYYTEGFPGTILDAYISGLPVIATNWLNAKEFIDDNKTGYIVDFDNDQLFVRKVIELVKNPSEILNLKKNVEVKRDSYSADKAWEVLKNAIYN